MQEREGVTKRIVSEESALEQLRAKLHGVLQEAKMEQVALPLVGGGTFGGSGGKGGSRRRKRREDGEEGSGDEEEEEEEEEEGVSFLYVCEEEMYW